MFEDRPAEWTLYVQVTNEGAFARDVRVHWVDMSGHERDGEIGDLEPGKSDFFGIRQLDANVGDRGSMYVTTRDGDGRSKRLEVPYERDDL